MSTLTASTILCCECGVPIAPNSANTCVGCLRARVDITIGIERSIPLFQCRGCERYKRPKKWAGAARESRELLAICLEKLKTNKAFAATRLVDAAFIWTEEHSKRLKVRLTLQKEVLSGTVLQQEIVVEYVITNFHCEDCHRAVSAHTWNSLVQVRQRVDHKRTFLFLEQLLIKHNAHEHAINIRAIRNGLDFFFAERSKANQFISFLQTVIPCRSKSSRQLISQDKNNGVDTYKFTFAVEIVPLCKFDVVCLPTKLANDLGTMNNVALVFRVNTGCHVIDPQTCTVGEITPTKFWREPFDALCSSHRGMVEFMVMGVEHLKINRTTKTLKQGAGKSRTHSKKARRRRNRKRAFDEFSDHSSSASYNSPNANAVWATGKYSLALVEVARVDDLESGDTLRSQRRISVRTHLGRVLKVGDFVKGYELSKMVFNDHLLKPLKVSYINRSLYVYRLLYEALLRISFRCL
eukprot:g102.t1